MKSYICIRILGVLMGVLPFYCQAVDKTTVNVVKLGEEKARTKMLENPSPENIAKHKK